MNADEDDQRTTWIPFAIAGVLVAIILAVILTVDGSSEGNDPKVPSTPTSSATP